MSEKRCKNHPERPAVIRTDGISRGLCRECLTSMMKKAQKARAAGQAAPKADRAARPGRPRRVPREKNDDLKGMLQRLLQLFEEYPDLLARLKTLAHDEFRSLEMEILFLLQVQTQDPDPKAD